MSEDRLIVVCFRPGLWRGGRPNPQLASYALDEFAPEQLAQLVFEPEIKLIVGRLVTPATLAGAEGPSLLPMPLRSDAGRGEQGLAHGVQPSAVVTEEGDVTGLVAADAPGPVQPAAAPTPATPTSGAAQTAQEAEAEHASQASQASHVHRARRGR